jgi:hypothetical protein
MRRFYICCAHGRSRSEQEPRQFLTAKKAVYRTGPPVWKSIPGLLAKNLQIWAKAYKYIQSRRQKPNKSRETCSLFTGSFEDAKNLENQVNSVFPSKSLHYNIFTIIVIQRQHVRTQKKWHISKIKGESIEYNKNN